MRACCKRAGRKAMMAVVLCATGGTAERKIWRHDIYELIPLPLTKLDFNLF